MKATDAQLEAIEIADAQVNNFGLPTYSELVATIRWIASHPSYQVNDLKKIAGDMRDRLPQLCPPTYTERYEANSGAEHSLTIRCAPGVDFDGRFAAWNEDENELIYINGWLFTFEKLGE